MINLPLISVILPCYNGENTIEETLNSIKRQSYKNIQLIFIDDGSSDNSLQIANKCLIDINFDVHIITRKNRGFLFSLEEGIESSRGEFIARIDHDDIWAPQHLELLMHEFVNDKELVLVGSQATIINDEGRKIAEYHLPLSNEDIIRHFHKDNPFIHSSVIFRKNIYEKTAGYLIGNDESSAFITDYNLWFELSKFGKCKNIYQYTLYYRYSETSMSRRISKSINIHARLEMMRKVNNYYKTYKTYSYYQQSKVLIRLLQSFFVENMFKVIKLYKVKK